ncbi:LLM class flavin-dependent oxidoreductase [Mycobacterium sp. NBC_00419]|uniref:LLM class flavin-dependent oxidoreductase n=1 Tax=Mycobacterium sp. NBC_00419 TaxID=2975989 RepID=UPI002E230013
MVQGTGVAESQPQRPIKVGVYFDLRNPPQWRQDPARLYGFTLEACEEAERLGADSIWFSEHHLFDDDYLASPLTFAAAAGARTKKVRLGTAIVIAPLHHPAELAEQCAVIDLVSNGRLDLGLGTGYRVPEFELYGTTLERRYGRTDGTARALRELWGPDGVRPGPVQNPVPIWMGYQGPKGARRAGLLGEGLLTAEGAMWEPYAAGLAEAGHPVESGRMAGGLQAWASDDPERDWPVVSEHLAHQLNSYRKHMVEGTDTPVPHPVNVDKLVNSDRTGPLASFTYGTPEFVVDATRRYIGEAPVETVYLWASVGGMSEDMVMRNIETICTRVKPLLNAAEVKAK